MTAQPHNRFVFCVVVVEFAVNGNQALETHIEGKFLNLLDADYFLKAVLFVGHLIE